MNALDSPLEALAFDYLRYGLFTAVNSIWTWIAVITAAVSFWRIKATSEHPRGKITDVSSSAPVRLISSSTAKRVSAEPAAEVASRSYETTPVAALDRQGSTKGKFTLYYENEDGDGEVYGDGDGNGEEVATEEGWWERVVKMRMGDEGWYSYQDLTVINGNVVRLWDDCRRRNVTPLEFGGGLTWQ